METATEKLGPIINQLLEAANDPFNRTITSTELVEETFSFGQFQEDATFMETINRRLDEELDFEFFSFFGIEALLRVSGTCNGCPTNSELTNQITRKLQDNVATGVLDIDEILRRFNIAVGDAALSNTFGTLQGIALLQEIAMPESVSQSPSASPTTSSAPTVHPKIAKKAKRAKRAKKSKKSKKNPKASKRKKSAKKSRLFTVPNTVVDESSSNTSKSKKSSKRKRETF
jgi:hypothetical protein